MIVDDTQNAKSGLQLFSLAEEMKRFFDSGPCALDKKDCERSVNSSSLIYPLKYLKNISDFQSLYLPKRKVLKLKVEKEP